MRFSLVILLFRYFVLILFFYFLICHGLEEVTQRFLLAMNFCQFFLHSYSLCFLYFDAFFSFKESYILIVDYSLLTNIKYPLLSYLIFFCLEFNPV